MIEVSHLTKKYGSLCAVDDISFTAREGEILGFLGPNGAGKTTTMNMITGYISITDGKVTVSGHDVFENPLHAKRRIGYLPEQPPLYLDMTVDEYLRFVSRLKKSPLDEEQHLAEICALVRLDKVRHRLIKNLSKGYRQRVGIAQALVGNPPILILDEPTVGIDPNQIVEVRSLIRKLGKRHTVILSTHILGEVQAVCDRVIVLNEGKIVADSTTEELSDMLTGGRRLICTVAAPENGAIRLLSSIPGVKKVTSGGEKNGECELIIEVAQGKDVRREIFTSLAHKDLPMLGLRECEMSLEDIFIALTK
ncbi:MAG: ATP-binding cassette domain-containing protein [Clostridia bacterium]|nr:ATP-binding cassette domain-containing protein [Clostridia bacterium]